MPESQQKYRPLSIEKLTEKRMGWVLFAFCFVILPTLLVPGMLYVLDYVTARGEVRFAERDTEQVKSLFASKLDFLSRTVHDWAAWDDTYQFVQDGNQDFIDNNIYEDSFSNLGVELVVFVDQAGSIVYSYYQELSEDDQQNADSLDVSHLLEKYPQLHHHKEIDSEVAGYALVDGNALLLVARPIVTTQSEGPIQGTLIFGLNLDQDELENVTLLSQKKVAVRLAGVDASADLVDRMRQAEASGDNAYIQAGLDNQLTSSFFLTDLNHAGEIIVQVESTRALSAVSQLTSIIYRLVVFGVGIVFFLVGRPMAVNYLRSYRAYYEYLNRFQAVVQQSQEAILLVDCGWRILDYNQASKELLGVLPGNTIPLSLGGYLSSTQKFDREFLERLVVDNQPVELICKRRDGTDLVIEISASRISNLTPESFSIILRDITQRKEIETRLKASEERYQLATQGAKDGLWDWNLMNNRIYYSTRWKAMLGYSKGEIQDAPEEWTKRVHPEDSYQFQALLSEHLRKPSGHFQCEHRLRFKDGSYHWMLSRGVAVWSEEGYATRMAGSLTDIDERKRLEEQLRFDALHDGLTHLANRTLILDHLKHVNERKKRRPEMIYALFFIDLDRFKQVNDTLGHGSGDLVLIEISRRLELRLRSGDMVARCTGSETLARIAGDEFLILVEDFQSTQDVYMVAERVLQSIQQPVWIDGKDVVCVGGSIGVLIPEKWYENAEDLIRDADIAMYQAKKVGGDAIVLFTPDMYSTVTGQVQLENELRLAVERKEFVVHYQPIFSLSDDRLAGFEALVRWNHPQRGLMLPAEFIDIAEETGLIIPLGYTVLEESCRQMVAWQRQYDLRAEVTLSVNLSARQLLSADLVERVRAALAQSGFAASSLWLEITESYLLKNIEAIRNKLDILREMGVRIEIDDFGSGYSSFNLHNLHVDGYKIDRSYIQNTGAQGRQLLMNLVAFGQNLGLTQVAEGVERIEQKELLQSLNCAYGQGYLLAYPIPPGAVGEVILAQQARD